MRRKRIKLSKAEKLNRQIASWEKKQEDAVIMLRRSAEELLKLRRQRRRNLERETKALRAKPVEPHFALSRDGSTIITNEEAKAEAVETVEPPKDDGLELGPFDRRGKDEAARAAVQAEVDAEKKRKADKAAEKRAIKKEIVQAELTGKRRKLPLSGKAALDFIRG